VYIALRQKNARTLGTIQVKYWYFLNVQSVFPTELDSMPTKVPCRLMGMGIRSGRGGKSLPEV
jgi:hypothetical protein